VTEIALAKTSVVTLAVKVPTRKFLNIISVSPLD
jgi:hypothetical protein